MFVKCFLKIILFIFFNYSLRKLDKPCSEPIGGYNADACIGGNYYAEKKLDAWKLATVSVARLLGYNERT